MARLRRSLTDSFGEYRSAQCIPLKHDELFPAAQILVITPLEAFEPLAIHAGKSQYMREQGAIWIEPSPFQHDPDAIQRERFELASLLGIQLPGDPDKMPLLLQFPFNIVGSNVKHAGQIVRHSRWIIE